MPTQKVSPLFASNYPITDDDFLRVDIRNIASSPVIDIIVRHLNPQNEIIKSRHSMLPASDASLSTQFFELTQGFLISISIRTSTTATLQGDTYIVAGLQKGKLNTDRPNHVLISDYLVGEIPLTWEPVLRRVFAEGPGSLVQISGTNPAAGSNFRQTVATNTAEKVLGLKYNLANSAAPGNRLIRFTVELGGNVVAGTSSDFISSANETLDVYHAIGSTPTTANLGHHSLPLPDGIIIREGYTWGTNILNIQAGDAITSIFAVVERWVSP